MIRRTTRPHMQDAVRASVEPGSIVMTDTATAYKSIQDQFIHMTVNHAKSYAKGRIHTNGVENFWSLLRRALEGTYMAC